MLIALLVETALAQNVAKPSPDDLGATDYADAERVTGERLRAVEEKGQAAAGHLPIFLSLMAEVERLQGKHDAAFPLYARLYQLWLNNQLPADFQKRSTLGYVECLIVRGETATAEMVAQPPVDTDGSPVGPSFHEDIFNTYAVAMEAEGHRSAAEKFEEKIDTGSRRRPAANQQDHDLLRARLMSARKQVAARKRSIENGLLTGKPPACRPVWIPRGASKFAPWL